MNLSKQIIADSGIAFGTSGARGLVEQFTPEACAAFTAAFVEAIKGEYEVSRLALAIDNRPSSYAMAQACAAAANQQGISVGYYGVIPTPALAYQAMQDAIPCIMVTGSHIPFDRNGLKFYRPDGEITKQDELAILDAEVELVLPSALPELAVSSKAADNYLARYSSLFSRDLLQGKKIGIYEHSSAGRELYSKLFSELGAEVVSLERSDEFVPIDTEAVSEEDKAKARAWSAEFGFDAIFSTDGDGDRPLVADENGEYLRGDVLGLLCAEALSSDALAVPVSCNTAIELSNKFSHVERTKIGSPYVIAEFAKLAEQYQTVCGFEANGGFLLGSEATVNGKPIAALPTRDAVLPALMLLHAASEQPISKLVEALPKRFTHSDRIKNFATETSKAIIAAASVTPQDLVKKLGLEAQVDSKDETDGLRLSLSDQTVIHLRPSGNAPELRCYAEADDMETAIALVNQVLSKIPQLA